MTTAEFKCTSSVAEVVNLELEDSIHCDETIDWAPLGIRQYDARQGCSAQMNDLPTELLCDVLQLVAAALGSVRHLRATCRGWRDFLDGGHHTLHMCRRLHPYPRDLGALTTLLRRMPHLHTLQCTPMSSLSFLGACPSLTCLSVEGPSRYTDATPLSSCVNLTSLSLRRSGLCDLRPLHILTRLASLDLSGSCMITSLAPLALLHPTLTHLDLSFCLSNRGHPHASPPCIPADERPPSRVRPSDISALGALASLQSLHLGGCHRLRSIKPLASCTSLLRLDLDGCYSVSDLRPLSTCAELVSLDLSQVAAVSTFLPLVALTALTGLKVCRGLYANEEQAIRGACLPALCITTCLRRPNWEAVLTPIGVDFD